MPLFRSWVIDPGVGNGGLPAHICQQTYDYYQTWQGVIEGHGRIFGDCLWIPGSGEHLYPVEEYMCDDRGPDTAAIPKHRSQENAKEHPGQESGELKMDRGKKKGRRNDTGPG